MRALWRSRRRQVVTAVLGAVIAGGAFVTVGHAEEYDANGTSPWVPIHCAGTFPSASHTHTWQVEKFMAAGTVPFTVTQYFIDAERNAIMGSG